MKCRIIYGLTIFMLFLAFGCNESDDGSYAEPITIYEKINGDWGLMNLKMVDEFAKANAVESTEQDLSTQFNYPDFQIQFNVDGNNQPTTYEVIGDVPPLFALKGYWKLSSSFQQTNANAILVYLYSDASKTKKTDELRLTSVPGSNKQMELQLVRTSGGAPFVSYVFKLKSIN